MMNFNPLLLPKILSKVFEYADMKTLKASRLVSRFWNSQVGRLLSSSSWIIYPFNLWNPYKKKCKKLHALNKTLANSPDPSKFFGKLLMGNNSAWGRGSWVHMELWKDLLQNYGKYLKTLDYHYYQYSWNILNGPTNHLFLHGALSKWCPLLQEIVLTVKLGGLDRSRAALHSLHFKGTLNLQSIKLKIHCEIADGIQDFLVRIVAASRKLKLLRIWTGGYDNARLYQKLFALEDMTKNLSEFNWIGPLYHIPIERFHNDQEIVRKIHFSNELKTFRLHYELLSPTTFHFLLTSFGQSLKTLELMNFGKDFEEQQKYIQSHLFKTVITTLVNLETLRIGFHFCSHDQFFSNAAADNLIAHSPHQNLRRLLLPTWAKSILWEVSSVSNVVKCFPNLTLLSLCFGNKRVDNIEVGIRLQEAVGILSKLKGLKDLSLRFCSSNTSPGDLQPAFKALKIFPCLQRCLRLRSNTSPGDLQLAFKALKNFPCLQRCTFVELGDIFSEHKLKKTYASKDLEDDLNGLQHLTFIRLIGFKIAGAEKILKFANEKGIKLEIYKELLSRLKQFTWEERWLMTYPE